MNESFGGNLDNVIRNLEEKINSIKTTYKIWDTLLIVCMFKANLFINTRANNSIITSFFPTPYSDLHLWRILSPWWHRSMRHIWVPIFCWPPSDALRWPSPPRWNMPDENWRSNQAHTHSQSICPVSLQSDEWRQAQLTHCLLFLSPQRNTSWHSVWTRFYSHATPRNVLIDCFFLLSCCLSTYTTVLISTQKNISQW